MLVSTLIHVILKGYLYVAVASKVRLPVCETRVSPICMLQVLVVISWVREQCAIVPSRPYERLLAICYRENKVSCCQVCY